MPRLRHMSIGGLGDIRDRTRREYFYTIVLPRMVSLTCLEAVALGDPPPACWKSGWLDASAAPQCRRW